MTAKRWLRFAFDLGTNSIGWAIYQLDCKPAPGVSPSVVDLLACGVRLYDDGRNPKDGRSLAEMRRVPRAMRTRRDRFVMRRATLINELVHAGLLPSDSDKRRTLSRLDPYRLRAEGLDHALTPHEIGRVLMHLNQRRGFQSNRRADRKSKDNDSGLIAQGMAQLTQALKQSSARTFGEYLWRRHGGSDGSATPRTRQSVRIRVEGQGAKALYEMYPSRKMLKDEFDAIMTAQAVHHPALLTPETIANLRETIFHQRSLRPVEVGLCTFVPGERRLPRALPSVEMRVIYETLNQLRYGTGLSLEKKLTAEQRDLLATGLTRGDGVTFPQLRKILGIGADVRFSLEEGGKDGLKDFAARSADLAWRKLKGKQREERFGERWFALPLAERDDIVHRLIETDDEAAVVAWLQADYNLSAEAAKAVATWTPREGYARLGPTANARILAELKAPDLPTYAKACERAGWHHSDERDGVIELPLPYYGQVLERHVLFGTGDPEHEDQRRYGRFPNPTAHIALNQLRRVVNRMVKAYGEPAQIVIELARNLKMSRDQKDELNKRNRSNKEIRDRHRAILQEQGQPETADNFLRLKLYEEQERAGGGVAWCPFSLQPIGVKQLFSSEIEVEHLLPYSRTFDDSAANKIVCLRSMNRLKRSRSPHEAFANRPEWLEIAAAALALPRNKRWRFAADAMQRFENEERDFLARQLGETRHISRMARIYLSRACDPDQVYVTTGQLTAMLRARWGLNSLFSDHNMKPDTEAAAEPKSKKSRDDHRHHAVDACVIGAIDRWLLNEMSRRAGQAEIEGRERVTADVPDPFVGFRDAVRARLDTLVVSIKPEHGTGGALHEDTAYGIVDNAAEAAAIGNLVFRKPLVALTPGEIDRIRDERLRAEVRAATASVRDDKKALAAALERFSGQQNEPGRVQGVRRVRIGKKEKNTVAVRDRRTGAAYKALIPGENHLVDIVQMRDGTWRGFAATVFEVNQKGWRPQWEVQKLGGKLVMRLHKGDLVEIDDADGLRRIKVVHRIEISANRIRLATHNEGGKLSDRHDDRNDPFRWDFATISLLKCRNARKVKVDEIGAVSRVRSNN